MKALSLTCSTTRGSLAITHGQTVLASQSWKVAKSHGEIVTESLKDALNECSHSIKDLDALVVDHGPGSFTGIRIAINTMRTLGYATDLPIYSFNSLEVLAASVHNSKLPVAALLNAYSNSVYISLFSPSGECLKGPQVSKITELSSLLSTPHTAVGDAMDFYREKFEPSLFKNLVEEENYNSSPCALEMAKLFYQKQEQQKAITWKELLPFYIRLSSAEEKRLVLS